MAQLKVGVAGVRRGSSLCMMFQHHPQTDLVAVCDIAPGRADAYAKEHNVPCHYEDYKEFIAHELDIVVVATPAPVHAEQSIAAMQAGKHVLSEVPAAYTLDECEQILRAVKSTGMTYMMGENCNYFPRTEAWKREVDNGRLGTIFYGEAEYIHCCMALMRDEQGNPTWRASLPPIHYCTHSLGPLMHITGDRVVSVSGLHTGSHYAPDLGSIDIEVGIMKTEQGAVFKILCGFSLCHEPGFHRYTLYGTKGFLDSQRCDWDCDKGHFPDEAPGMQRDPVDLTPREAPPEAALGGHGTSEYFMINDFVQAILTDTPPPIDIYTSLDMTAPGICAHLSAERGGERVDVPDWRKL